MKRLFSLAVAAALVVGAASVYADGGGCCMAHKTSAKSGACTDMMDKLSLTDAQKAKISALKDQTTRTATSTSEARQMMSRGMQQILTPEQYAQWQSGCEKASKASTSGAAECPFMKSMKKSADKTS